MPANVLQTTESLPAPITEIASIAVLIPCYNEEAAIAGVVRDFRKAFPGAAIYVYDNNSTDATRARAEEAGALVRTEQIQGKGHVVRRMFSDIEADSYVLVDGDGTYDASAAPFMVELLLRQRLDMVVGCRVEQDPAAYRPGHRLGNAFFTGAVARIFGARFKDILSGYRVFSRRFVKSFPVLAGGFEIETEITVHALTLNMPIEEVQTQYRARPEGSASKLRTYRDGFRIVSTIFNLFREQKPLPFFSIVSALLIATSLILAWPIFLTYLETGLVPRFPTAILATGIGLLGFLSLTCGFVLDTVTRGRREMAMLAYLSLSPWNRPR